MSHWTRPQQYNQSHHQCGFLVMLCWYFLLNLHFCISKEKDLWHLAVLSQLQLLFSSEYPILPGDLRADGIQECLKWHAWIVLPSFPVYSTFENRRNCLILPYRRFRNKKGRRNEKNIKLPIGQHCSHNCCRQEALKNTVVNKKTDTISKIVIYPGKTWQKPP